VAEACALYHNRPSKENRCSAESEITTLDDGGFRFFRDVGDITIDTINVEGVEVNALGGDDMVDGSADHLTEDALDYLAQMRLRK
jgi:hypothetical protein